MILPPLVTRGARRLGFSWPANGRLGFSWSTRESYLEYAPEGWRIRLRPGMDERCDSEEYVRSEVRAWTPFIQRCTRGGTEVLSQSEVERYLFEHHEYMVYGYVLGLAAHQKEFVRILDYGGSLGFFYCIGRALRPDVRQEFHCKELPRVVDEGRKLLPQVHWHTDDSCLGDEFDLVVIAGCLQYVEDWKSLMRRVAACVRGFCLVTRVASVEHAPTYVAIDRVERVPTQVLNKAELLAAMEESGFRLVREFIDEPHPSIANAPEQPVYGGWLFARS